MQTISEKEANMAEIIKILDRGGLVIFPCETVYGAAVNALDEQAILKLTQYKQRPMGKPYSIMVADKDAAEKYAQINPTAEKIYQNFLPGPITVISKGRHTVARGIESETGDIGIRIPQYKFLLRLLRKYGKPLTATSANASYKKRPYKISDILNNISEKQKRLIDLVIDAGELPHNEPSTVIDTTPDDPVLLRQGEIMLSEENEVLSRSEESTQNIGKDLWQKYEKYLGTRAIVFALVGEMGAGKTEFTKGLARAVGIEDDIVSPTFNLEMDYGKLTHMDAWRMQSGTELRDLGWEKKIKAKTILAIEWADRVADEIRKYDEEAIVVWVKIRYGTGKNDRFISWKAV